MKKLLFISALLFAGVCLMAQAIPDGGFEFWHTATWMDPQGFSTSNVQSNGYNASYGLPANVSQVAGEHGSFGAQIKTILFCTDTMGGFLINANVNGNGIKGGIPYAQKPTGLRFYYKYATTGVDTACVLVFFKKSGSIIDSFFSSNT